MYSLYKFDEGYDLQKAKKRTIDAWEQTGKTSLEECDVKSMLPVIKLTDSKTYPPWEECHFPGLIVKLEHLISEDGMHTSSLYDRVLETGGLHNFLKYPGIIILSSIMPDRAIAGLSLQQHADIINSLRPDYHITPDGETYLNERHLSAYEINRMMKWTEYLLDNCSGTKPIGLIKGSCVNQIEDHTDRLSDLGLEMFAFHAGDFLFRSNKSSVQHAKTFYSSIRKAVPWLMVYGVGSDKNIRIFSGADCFVVQSHYINAFHRQKITEFRTVQSDISDTRERIVHNMRVLESIMIRHEAERIADHYEVYQEGMIKGAVLESG